MIACMVLSQPKTSGFNQMSHKQTFGNIPFTVTFLVESQRHTPNHTLARVESGTSCFSQEKNTHTHPTLLGQSVINVDSTVTFDRGNYI